MKTLMDIPSSAEQHKAAQTIAKINKLIGENPHPDQLILQFQSLIPLTKKIKPLMFLQ